MGCVSSKNEEKGEKYEKKTEDDAPAEPEKAEEKTTTESSSPVKEDDKNEPTPATPAKKPEDPTHLIKLFYDNIDPNCDDDEASFRIDRSRIRDTAEEEKIKGIKYVYKDEKATGSYLSRVDKEDDFTPFTNEQKQEVTSFLNEIEKLADSQGLFGDLGQRK